MLGCTIPPLNGVVTLQPEQIGAEPAISGGSYECRNIRSVHTTGDQLEISLPDIKLYASFIWRSRLEHNIANEKSWRRES